MCHWLIEVLVSAFLNIGCVSLNLEQVHSLQIS